MYIEWIEYENQTTGQKIEHIDFQRVNLLVGLSAAGKSQILKTITRFLRVAMEGKSIASQCKFSMQFRLNDQSNQEIHYFWSIKTDSHGNITNNGEAIYPICEEILKENDKQIIKRNIDDLSLIHFNKVPKVSRYESALYAFRENEPMYSILDVMRMIASSYHQDIALRYVYGNQFSDIRDIVKNSLNAKEPIRMEALYRVALPISLSIYIAKQCLADKYEDFLADLQSIFPDITDIDIQEVLPNNYGLAIKQDNKIILQSDISSGMLRTIYILAALHFHPYQSVVFIDELENSLGLNCLDDVVDRILENAYERKIQFFLTSHHPYIITAIPVKNWLVISQKHGVISNQTAAELGIKDNRQEKFFDLMNYMKRQQI